MKVAVLGPGGVGGLLAAILARQGHGVSVIVRPGAVHPPEIRVESDLLGDFKAEVKVADRLTEPVDLLLVTVKAMQLGAAVTQAPAALVRSAVVPLLNGISHVADLQAAYGPSLVAPGTIRVEAERLEPGHIVQKGGFVIVEVAGDQAVLDELVATLNAGGVRASRVADAGLALWTKLSLLAPFALASTASGLDIGRIREDVSWRARIEGAMREVAEVAAAEGYVIDPPLGFVDAAHPGMRTSMQKDRAAGRPVEVDHLAGPILEAGRRHGIPTPITEELAALVKAG